MGKKVKALVIEGTVYPVKGEKGDALTWNDLTEEQKASLKGEKGDDGADGADGEAGPQGPQGATGVYDATTQDFLTTLETTIGASQTKTMTQGSITKEVLPIKDIPGMAVPGKDTGYLKNDGARATSSSSYKVTDYVMLEEGQTKLHIVSGVWKPSSYSQVCFYSQPDEEDFVDKINEGTASTERTNVDYDIPSTAKYCRFTVKPDVDAIISVKGSIVKRLEDVEGGVADIESDIAEVRQSQAQNTLTMQKAAQMLDINILSAPCAEGKEGKLLAYTTANGHQEKTVSGKGITDFIPVTGESSILLVSGFYQGSGTEYRLAEFYSEASMGNEVGTGLRATTMGAISDMEITVPEDAAYVRLSLASKDTAGVLQMGEPTDIAALKEAVDGMQASKFEVAAQIRNNPLPVKATTEELNILFIGSSYSVDTITALHDICASVGLHVNTGNFYKSGAKISEYLEMIESGEDTVRTYYFNCDGGARDRDGESKSVTACVRNQGTLTKNWDIIIIDDDKGRSPQYTAEKNEDLAKFVEWLKMNATNPRVVLALNSTWVFKANMDKQEDSFRLVMKNMHYTGIDVVVPSGAAICNLRETALNDGSDMYRDDLHLDLGVGRFTAACAAYYALVYPVFGVPLDQCDCTGHWDGQGNVNIEGYPATILVTDANRATCMECAKKANANRFLL